MNTYRYTFIAACPGNGEQIIYSLELRHTQKVLVEHIKTACALHKLGHQEDIAADLHTRFGGHLTLRAVHHGVDIETVLAAPAQAQEDARDADRYRWVKQQAEFFPLVMDGTGLLCAEIEEAEEAIDAEIAAARAAQGGAKP